ncbi:Polynucleotide 5'-hydroxyl-kinase GRC3 [Yarrowia sp. B02]|nr:Polynucleotide 5'-hydroxyl-kinase GRC3 [Yarrowia sp. B02]
MSEQLSRFDPALTQYASVTSALNQHKIRVQAVSGANAGLQPVEFVLEKGTTVTALKWTKNVGEGANSASRRKKTKTADSSSPEEYLVSVGTNRGDILTFSPAQAKLVSALRGGHSLPVADFDVDAASGTSYSLDNRGLLNVWKGSQVERSVDKTGAKLVAVLPSGNVLLATHNIAVYGPQGDDSQAVSFDAPLFDIPSHTSTVTELCVRGDLVAAVAGDRLINVVNVAQKKIVLVLMAESGAQRVSMNGDVLTALTESGTAEFFQLAQTNGSTPKKNKRKSIVTKAAYASLDIERGTQAAGQSLAIDAIALTAKEAYYSYTERAQAQFAHVTLASLETEPTMTVVHDPKNAANHYTEERTVPVSYNEEDALIAAGDDYSQLEHADESDDDESATLAEKMDALKRENKTSKGVSGTAPPTMGSLSTVLTQAIKSDDDDLLESCLLFRDKEGIKSTVQRLNSNLAVLLLERLATKMTAQPSRGRQFNAWIKWVMVAHGGYLVTVPKLLVTVSRLHKALNTRVNTLDRLLALEGRLEMLEAQMELRNASHGANDDDEESDSEVEFVEGEEDIEEDDEDDMSEIMAMGDDDVDMEEDDEEEEDEDDDEDDEEDEDEDEIALPDSDEDEMKQVLNKKRGKHALSALKPTKKQVIGSEDSDPEVVVVTNPPADSPEAEESFISIASEDQTVRELTTFDFGAKNTKVVREEARGRSRVFHGMKFKETIVLRGAYVVTVWSGAIHINGALVSINSPVDIPVYAPASHAFPQIEAAAGAPETRESGDEDVMEALHQLEGYSAIVEISAMPRRSDNPLMTVKNFGKMSSANVVPFVRQLWHCEDDGNNYSRIYNTASVVTRSQAAVVPGIYDEWAEVCDDIRRVKNGSTMVVGSQNTGKSTFCKYLSAFLTTKKSGTSVAFVDLDPSNCEFTAPGQVSVTVIGAGHLSPYSILGPSFTHITRPAYSRFVGYNNPKDDTRGYIEACKAVIDHAKGLRLPLVVNTCGWVRAAGHDLLHQLMDHVRPSDVVFTRDPGIDADQARLAEAVKARSHILDAPDAEPPRFTGAEQHTLQTVSYLHAGNLASHLDDLEPLEVGLDAVYLGILDSEGLDLADVALSTNSTLVAVMTVDKKAVKNAEVTPDGLQYLPNFDIPQGECLGQAVVQFAGASVRLHTPVSASLLNAQAADKAIVLVRGRIPLPVYELWDSRKGGEQDYVSFDVSEGVGSEVWVARRGLKRK